MKNIFKLIAVASGFAALTGCTDLTETIYSDNTTDNFYNNKNEVISAVLRPYTHSGAVFACQGRDNYWRLNELSADQLAWPVKGPHGYDDAKWIQLHYHTWNTMHNTINEYWWLSYMGIGFCNDAIANLEERSAESMHITEEERLAFVAELRANRAYYHMCVMDIFGNAPIATKVENEMAATNSRQEIFDFVEKELLEVIDELPLLSKEERNSGRFTRAAGYAILATLYLNAEVWTGTPRWDDCITYCNKVMNGEGGAQNGTMALDQDINLPFSNTNSTDSKENILVLTYDYMASNTRCGWSGDFYHFNQKFINGGDRNGNDGVVVIPTAYDAFADNDLRKKEWMLIGPQYYYDDPTKPVVGTSEYSGLPLEFVKDIKRFSEGKTEESTMYTGEENSGARFAKYKEGPIGNENYCNNDWVLFRLTEMYFIKAEALMRKNSGKATQEAVDLINECRKRNFADADWEQAKYTTATLTMDELLAERGREFIFEGKRRTDLIRFDKFGTGNWWDGKVSDEHCEIYPIPYQQTALNPNLIQNTGYNQ